MGVVLYVMCTGRPPFSGSNLNALYAKIKAVDYKCPEYFSKGKNVISARNPFFLNTKDSDACSLKY